MKKIFLGACLLAALGAQAQNEPYVKETDPLVLQKLDEWQDWKFGLMMHWGTYSQWGIVESWSLCPEDEGWTQRKPAGIPLLRIRAEIRSPGQHLQPAKV